MLKIRRAVISVWDKRGIVELARLLNNYKVELISTGRTALLIRKNNVPVKEVTEYTSFPEILSGRVKTLHPKIMGGILTNKKHPLHLEEISRLGIEPIDMVVVNFYPFKKMIDENISFSQMMEYIDIGGPTLLRAGAKNYRNVACLSSPQQYREIMEELKKNNGSLCENTLKRLANEVFRLTKEYDTYIYSYFKGKKIKIWDLEQIQDLRYGENPHQRAGLFRLINNSEVSFQQLQGKNISYNNLMDIDAAFSLLKEFPEPTTVIIKHHSPLSVACGRNIYNAYSKAADVDPLSSFGAIIGLNRKVDKKTGAAIVKSGFKECVVAPNYSKETLRLFADKKNLRVIVVDFHAKTDLKDVRRTSFGYLIQSPNNLDFDKTKLKVVTKRKPTTKEWRDLFFAWKVVKYVKSNAIVVARNLVTLGIGGGQPSRVGAVQLAIDRAFKSTQGAVLASDAFFPKEDSINLIRKAKIKAIIQPGGSIMDERIISLCNKFNLSMVFTGIRHFRH